MGLTAKITLDVGRHARPRVTICYISTGFSVVSTKGRSDKQSTLRLAALAESDLAIIQRARGQNLRTPQKQNHTRSGRIRGTHKK